MTELAQPATPQPALQRLQFNRAELAGAVADLGVLVPIAVALIVQNGLSATAVLLPAGLLYVVAGLLYRLPVPVQPLKAFGAIAITLGLGTNEIAAGALLMGGIFVLLGGSGLLDRVAKIFPRPIIRGVQLCVGLLFCIRRPRSQIIHCPSGGSREAPWLWSWLACCSIAARLCSS